MWLSVEKKQDLYLLIMTTDDQVADALDELEPSKRRLAAVYNRWSQKRVPGAGDAIRAARRAPCVPGVSRDAADGDAG
jgi:hypothetical protein